MQWATDITDINNDGLPDLIVFRYESPKIITEKNDVKLKQLSTLS